MTQNKVSGADLVNLTVRVFLGLALVVFGLIFLLMRFDDSIGRSPWWVTFVYVLGLSLVIGALYGYYNNRVWNGLEIGLGAFGLLFFVLGLIFTFDPTWSFTQGWTLFRGWDWGLLWPLVPLVIGAALLLVPFMNRQKDL